MTRWDYMKQNMNVSDVGGILCDLFDGCENCPVASGCRIGCGHGNGFTNYLLQEPEDWIRDQEQVRKGEVK